MSALDAEQLPIANDNKQVTEKMKTLTTVEFEALIEHGNWQREQNYEIVERYDHTDIIPCYEKGKNEHVKTERRWGWASKKSISIANMEKSIFENSHFRISFFVALESDE